MALEPQRVRPSGRSGCVVATVPTYAPYGDIRDYAVKLFENGKQTIVHMQGQLEKRKNIVQRLKDFDFLDIIGSLIALPIIFSFIYIVIVERGNPASISKEYLTIVSLILGYYFGRNKVK